MNPPLPMPFLPSRRLLKAALAQAMADMTAVRSMATGTRIVSQRPTSVEATRSRLTRFVQPHVITTRQNGQMVGVHTGGVLAGMVHIHPVRNRSIPVRPRETVGALRSVLAVTILVSEQQPIPTPGFLVDRVSLGLSGAGPWVRCLARSAESRRLPLDPTLSATALTNNESGALLISGFVLAGSRAESTLFRHTKGNGVPRSTLLTRLFDASLSAFARAIHMSRYLTGEHLERRAADRAYLGDKITGHSGVSPTKTFRGAVPRAVTAAPGLCVAPIVPQLRGIWGNGKQVMSCPSV